MFKWFTGISIIILFFYIQYIIINAIIYKRNYDASHFPCTYIKGICTIKPTWKNCSGGLPYDYCEKKINGFL